MTPSWRVAGLVLACLAVTGLAAGCGADTWDGTSPSLCPALPSDVVAEVATGLATETGDEADNTAERGELSPRPDDGRGNFYRCSWPVPGDDDFPDSGVTVSLYGLNPDALAEAKQIADQRGGVPLTGPVAGAGTAWTDGEAGLATWYCEWRQLNVSIEHPKGDPVQAAKRLAEALLPESGCAAT